MNEQYIGAKMPPPKNKNMDFTEDELIKIFSVIGMHLTTCNRKDDEARTLMIKIAHKLTDTTDTKEPSTKELVENLVERKGVAEIKVGPYEEFGIAKGIAQTSITADGKRQCVWQPLPVDAGPARILVVYD